MPTYRVHGGFIEFPDEYADRIGARVQTKRQEAYEPNSKLFDYQRDITRMAIDKKKFCVFADCGLGKTLIFLEFAKHCLNSTGKSVLIVSPLMVIPQTMREAKVFYGDDYPEITQARAANLQPWLDQGSGIAITNFEAIREDLRKGNIGTLIIDDSSMLKSHYGKWGTKLLELGAGLEYKMACTGTPAPNDRIEYANHAVFMDAFPSVNAFLARFFVNRGQTSERWEIKQHAVGAFYRALSHWSIFLSNPTTYGWEDNTKPLPPVHVHTHDVKMTDRQQELAYDMTGELFAHKIGGIGSRSMLGQIAKGNYKGEDVPTNKPGFIKSLLESWPNESTIIWCLYNYEQEKLANILPKAASITGTTPNDERQRIIEEFKSGKIKTIITKPKILGFGLNLQVATRHIFSGLQDSYESYYQAVKRSNRYGSKYPLNVHIPLTAIERPMIDTVLVKADMIDKDTKAQEALFSEVT